MYERTSSQGWVEVIASSEFSVRIAFKILDKVGLTWRDVILTCCHPRVCWEWYSRSWMKKFLELSGNFRSWTSSLRTPSHVLYIRSPWTCICLCICICLYILAFSSVFVSLHTCFVFSSLFVCWGLCCPRILSHVLYIGCPWSDEAGEVPKERQWGETRAS